MATSNYNSGSLTEHSIKRKLFPIIRGPVLKAETFVPANATRTMKVWLRSLQLTDIEAQLALKFVEQFLSTYEKRMRAILDELRQSVKKG